MTTKRNEKLITQKILAYLKSLGEDCFFFKVHGGPMQKSGIPDICVVYKGRSVWLEVKDPNGLLSEIQKRRMCQLSKAGAECYVVRSVEDAKCAVTGGGLLTAAATT